MTKITKRNEVQCTNKNCKNRYDGILNSECPKCGNSKFILLDSGSKLAFALKAETAFENTTDVIPEPISESSSFTDALLSARKTTHGDFARNARISQDLKRTFVSYMLNDGTLTDVQLEALDMIAMKLSRIFSGKADFNDHWDDIAGYAKLVADNNKIEV